MIDLPNSHNNIEIISTFYKITLATIIILLILLDNNKTIIREALK
jgi:hypothetical protein